MIILIFFDFIVNSLSIIRGCMYNETETRLCKVIREIVAILTITVAAAAAAGAGQALHEKCRFGTFCKYCCFGH